MAKAPSRTSGNRISNMMDRIRGKQDFGSSSTPEEKTKSFRPNQLITPELKTKLLQGSLEVPRHQQRSVPANSIFSLVSTSYSKVGKERLENRRILELMPEVKKAARLMVASIFSPNDLSRQEIKVNFDVEGMSDEIHQKLSEKATTFFQKKLNLKTSAPNWVYQFGYETGACVFAVVPLQVFKELQDESFIGTESFVSKIIDPLAHESLFGFGDNLQFKTQNTQDCVGLESFNFDLMQNESTFKITDANMTQAKDISKDLLTKFIGTEALNLTDNPAVLQANTKGKEKRNDRVAKELNRRYRGAPESPMLEISSDVNTEEKKGEFADNPLLMRLPAEAVTVIHTPGDPNDHQGYLVMLDIMGNPVNATQQEQDELASGANYNKQNGNIFNQIHNAYGIGAGNQQKQVTQQAMENIYSRVVVRHLEKRLGDAGFGHVEIPHASAILRSMFTRLLAEKKTRLLFLPKELVTYMSFDLDENGYGVSKLNGIKFSLGMKMAVQVSRVLASLKAAMDKRNLTLTLDENMMEQPETIINTAIQQYLAKDVMTFSTDPGYIQSQISEKSLSIKAKGLPGMENFDVSNEPDTSSGSRDFDPTVLDQLDKQIINGLDVPASTMNSLNEDEYARSVTTTNLFFAMEVSIYQDTTIRLISNLLKTYGKYSGELQRELGELCGQLDSKNSSLKKKNDDDSDTTGDLPQDCTFEKLMESLTISLPKPNIAPSKAQFDSLDAMVTSIGNMMNTLFPDELAGVDDKLRPVVQLLRSRFTAINLRAYLDNAGLTGMELPDTNFTDELKGISDLHRALYNIQAMLNDDMKLTEPKDSTEAPPSGY